MLCPADACEIGEVACPAGDEAYAPNKFKVLTDFTHEDIPAFENMLGDKWIELAGVEFLFDEQGRVWTYDININTNYNGQAETQARTAGTGRAGLMAVAGLLGELSGQQGVHHAAAECQHFICRNLTFYYARNCPPLTRRLSRPSS